MTTLQDLMMVAYRDPQSQKAVTDLFRNRLMNSKAANMSGMGAANDYGRLSLESQIAQATGQQAPGAFGSLMGGNEQDIGGHGMMKSIWDALR